MGATTTKKYFYLPALGASGQAELDTYNAALEVADSQLPVFPQAYATGTGTAIDPWAGDCINDAYTACSAGGTIYLRAGYYTLGTLLGISKSLTIIGEGIGKTFVVTDNAYGFLISTGVDYVTIKNLTIDGAAMDAYTSGRNCINATQNDYLLIENVEVKNAGYYGLNLNDPLYCIVKNVYAHDNDRHGVHPGANIASSNQHNIYQNIFAWDNGYLGFAERGGEDSGYNTYDNLQCWDNGTNNIDISNQFGSTVTNCIAYGGGTNNGFYITSNEDTSFTNCFSYLNYTNGAYISGNTNINLINFICKNNAEDDGANSSGFHLYDNTSVRMTSCQAYDDRGTKKQAYGIYFQNGTGDYVLTSCKIDGNLTANTKKLSFTGSITFDNGVVSGDDAVAGDIQYHNGTNWIRLAKGIAGQVLTMNAGATAPEWQAP